MANAEEDAIIGYLLSAVENSLADAIADAAKDAMAGCADADALLDTLSDARIANCVVELCN